MDSQSSPLRKKPPTPQAMKLRLASLCARSEQCEYDLRLKISGAGLPKDVADEIIKELKRSRFVDDARYARSYAHYKADICGWGRRKIIAGLMAHRISRDLINDALEEVDDEVFMNKVIKAARRKAESLDLTQYNDRQKLFRHLAAKGFTAEEAGKALEALRREGE